LFHYSQGTNPKEQQNQQPCKQLHSSRDWKTTKYTWKLNSTKGMPVSVNAKGNTYASMEIKIPQLGASNFCSKGSNIHQNTYDNERANTH